MSASSLRIIVAGLAGLHPVGGVAWDYLQYVIGLARLGHDVYYHEDTWSWPYHPIRQTVTDAGDYSANFIGGFFSRYAPELNNHWHYLHLHETSYGMDSAAFEAIAETADLFINVSGSCMLPDALSPGCTKVFLDTDPGYNQIMLSERFGWSENVERWCALVEAHDRHFTYGENIDGDDCRIPKVGFDWQTTRMPVVLSLWDRIAGSIPPEGAFWTTVMTWNAFKGPVVYRGVEYKSKGAEFEKLADLPGQMDVPLQVAVGGVNPPLDQLANCGWSVVDGPTVSLTPGRYQDFLARSRGEVSTAKQIYVALRSGWFSCRSACYLAAGRPVVVQDTGFSSLLPVGEGVLAFTSVEQAADAIRVVEADYARHTGAARDIAGAHFNSDRVLAELIDQALSVS